MHTSLPVPSIEYVQRVIHEKDPVLRNLQITQCYHELSAVLSQRMGTSANWCTFATWASKQAGQTIRKEDLSSMFERRLRQSPAALQASKGIMGAVSTQTGRTFLPSQNLGLQASSFPDAIDRASDAVSRGNKKVFEEIGHAFARFYQTCAFDPQPQPENLARFCEPLHPGDPPDGQGFLRQAFSHYYEAIFERDTKARAELILLANIEIGYHEQTRLQPEIAESLDAGLVSFLDFARPLFRAMFPANGLLHLAHLYLRRLLGRPTPLDVAIQSLLAEARLVLRQIITGVMMRISLPSGVVLKLGEDLSIGFPDSLQHLNNQNLLRLLAQHDHSPDSLHGSGAVDWGNLPDRLHFIIDLFRCYQERPDLFDQPFTADQVATMKAGSLPSGRL